VGPPQHFSDCRSDQDGKRHRKRICLLKGCNSQFYPSCPGARYCGPTCVAAARKWAQQEANRRYRATDKGKECRRAQAGRYRQRCREPGEPSLAPPTESGEGYMLVDDFKKRRCQRPGCYERFEIPRRSPLKTFCAPECRRAVRRVVVRERFWGLRLPDHPDFRREPHNLGAR
jgi:hypothetical protein